MMEDNDFCELIETYKSTVILNLRTQTPNLSHNNPDRVVRATVFMNRVFDNAGGLVECLRREGYTNTTFYRTTALLQEALYQAMILAEWGGVSPRFLGFLEETIQGISAEMPPSRLEQFHRGLEGYSLRIPLEDPKP